MSSTPSGRCFPAPAWPIAASTGTMIDLVGGDEVESRGVP
jgi:hypothetical protein